MKLYELGDGAQYVYFCIMLSRLSSTDRAIDLYGVSETEEANQHKSQQALLVVLNRHWRNNLSSNIPAHCPISSCRDSCSVLNP